MTRDQHDFESPVTQIGQLLETVARAQPLCEGVGINPVSRVIQVFVSIRNATNVCESGKVYAALRDPAPHEASRMPFQMYALGHQSLSGGALDYFHLIWNIVTHL